MTHVLGRDGVKIELFRELKNPPPFRIIQGADDAVIDRTKTVFGELRLDLRDDLVGRVVIPLHAGLIGAELLPGIKLDDFGAGLGGFLNRLEDAEPVERVSLAAEGEPADFAILGKWGRAGSR